jgi:hypothetical protein
MPKTVPCPQCGKQLGVPETLIGKKIKCAACSHVFVVPDEATPPSHVPPADAGFQKEIEPAIKKEPTPPRSEGEYPEDEPRPRSSRRWDDEEDDLDIGATIDKRSLKAPVTGLILPPGICLIVTGILGILVNLFQTVVAIASPEILQNNAFGQGAPPALSAISGVVFAILGAGTIAGGIAMMRQKMYGIAITGTVLAMLNIGNCCCVLGLPFGIWALVMLCRPDVKDAFS